MQICYPLRSKQIDMSTADRLIYIFQNNTGTPLSTLRRNAATLEFKAGFHMIASDRRRSQRDLFPYNRRRSQTIAEPTVAIPMSYVLARCARGKIKPNNMADIEEEILLQANFFLLLVLKRRQVSFKT